MNTQKAYCPPQVEEWTIVEMETSFLTSTEADAGIGNVSGTYYDFDWEDE